MDIKGFAVEWVGEGLDRHMRITVYDQVVVLSAGQAMALHYLLHTRLSEIKLPKGE